VPHHVALVGEEAAAVGALVVAPLFVHRARVRVAVARPRELGEAVRAGVPARFGLFPHAFLVKGVSVKKERRVFGGEVAMMKEPQL
jgi:hypothetical protein